MGFLFKPLYFKLRVDVFVLYFFFAASNFPYTSFNGLKNSFPIFPTTWFPQEFFFKKNYIWYQSSLATVIHNLKCSGTLNCNFWEKLIYCVSSIYLQSLAVNDVRSDTIFVIQLESCSQKLILLKIFVYNRKYQVMLLQEQTFCNL